MQCEHRVVVIRVAVGDEPLDLRVSDDALVLHRWRREGRINVNDINDVRPKNVYWTHAARAERIAAAAHGAPHPRERRISVREVRDDNAADALARIDDDSIITLTECVSAKTVERLCAAIINHPGITLRLHGSAAMHLEALAAAPLARLVLAGETKRHAPIPSLRHLELAHPYDLTSIAGTYPNLVSLRLRARGARTHVGDLRELNGLRVLDLSLVRLADADEFGELSQLVALRLNRVTGVRTTEALGALHLRTLVVEHLHELENVNDLARIESLEQLELIGLWQFDIARVEWTLDLTQLLRAEIDIGGRRKNLELYRRAQWAYPWRFPGTSSL